MERRGLLQLAALAGPGPALAQISTTPDWKPDLFSEHQNETFIVLSELIIPATDTPGAKAALVNRWADRLLAAGSRAQQTSFFDGLEWLDGYAKRLHEKPFVQLTEAEQTAILHTLDTSRDAQLEPGARFFRMAKSIAARIYYATEIGMKELNKGGRVPATWACAPSNG